MKTTIKNFKLDAAQARFTANINGTQSSGLLWLTLVKGAWEKGCRFADINGFDADNDWSFMRDSDNVDAMTERALNFLFNK